MRRFELVEGTSSKFWQVEEDGSDLIISWGRIGTNGQTQTKSFADPAKASAEATKLIDSKTKKGYAEVDAPEATSTAATAKPALKPAPAPAAAARTSVTPAPAAPATTPETASPTAQAATPEPAPSPQPSGTEPPWVTGNPIDPELIASAIADRSRPEEPSSPQWPKGYEDSPTYYEGVGPWAEPARELMKTFLTGTYQDLSPEAATLGLALFLDDQKHQFSPGAITLLAQRLGLLRTVELSMAAFTNVRCDFTWSRQSSHYELSSPPGDAGMGMGPYRTDLAAGLLTLRELIVAAEPDEYEACAALVRQTWASAPPQRRFPLAALIDEPALIDETARLFMDGTLEMPPDHQSSLCLPAMLGVDPETTAWAATKWPSDHPWLDHVMAATAVKNQGVRAVPFLGRHVAQEAASNALAGIGTPESLQILIENAQSTKAARTCAEKGLDAWPEAGLVALARVAAGGGRDGVLAEQWLRTRAAADPGLVDRVRQWVTPPAALAALERVTSGAVVGEIADAEDLPPVLASPPWKQKRKATPIPVLDVTPVRVPDALDWPTALVKEAEQEASWSLKNSVNISAHPEQIVERLSCQLEGASKEALDRAAEAAKAGDAEAFLAAWRDHLAADAQRRAWNYHVLDGVYFAQLGDFGIAVWNEIAGSESYEMGHPYLLTRVGLPALPGMANLIRRKPAEYVRFAIAFGSTSLAAPIARAYAKLKSARADARAWLLRWPEHAAAGLIPAALAKPGEECTNARTALRLLQAEKPDVLADVVSRYDAETRDAMALLLAADPLDELPARIPKLPTWWFPEALTRPVLLNGKALPVESVDDVGTMLALPAAEGLYPGIDQVRDACTPDSLAAFGWDVFTQWIGGGAPSKESWAMTCLGLFGDDETARKLTPFLRAWPGESQHKRAVAGLDVLAAIGSDVALMLLNGIAQKVKFKGLQDAATEKIAEIAEARGMTTDQLEDRLAPDLGLDEHGTTVLDFGPRQFTVGFDESLAPFVRDSEGARLKDLPKPRQTDDAGSAKNATATWKQLKKDARTVSAQQVFRFEKAMVDRRRWSTSEFEVLLAAHPLVRHVVRRLVWGLYEPDQDDPAVGGKLIATFRMAEDQSYTTGTDDPFDLPADERSEDDPPEVVVGVVHPLELTPEDAQAFGDLFADYEIGQPFLQLGRDTYELTPDELASTELTRWTAASYPSGRVRGLTNRGWRQGPAMDGGSVWTYDRHIRGDWYACVLLDPGIIVGYPDFEPTQNGVTLVVGPNKGWDGEVEKQPFSTIHPITASELIREMVILTS